MAEIKITPEASKRLAIIFLSCGNAMSDLAIDKFLRTKNRNLTFEEILGNKLSYIIPKTILGEIEDFANNQGNKITTQTIVKFFGRHEHIDNVVSYGLIPTKDLNKNQYLISHTPIPVMHLENKKFLYRNGGIDLEISGLYNPGFQINEKSYAIIHFATIIAPNCKKNLVEYLLREQVKNKSFVEALSKTKSIIYDKTFDDTKKRFIKHQSLLTQKPF